MHVACASATAAHPEQHGEGGVLGGGGDGGGGEGGGDGGGASGDAMQWSLLTNNRSRPAM